MFSAESLNFLQDAYTDILRWFAKSNTFGNDNSPTVRVIAGCGLLSHIPEVVKNGLIYDYRFWGDGQLYEFTGGTITLTGSNVLILNLVQSFDANADPDPFSDGIPRTVHQIYKVVLSQGLTGTGSFCDYADLVFPQKEEEWNDVSSGVGFNNSWTNAGAGYMPARFKKDLSGYVHLDGYLGNTYINDGTICFTLPIGYRPDYKMIFTGYMLADTTPTTCRIFIRPNGDVEIGCTIAPGSSDITASLCGIIFKAA
jgi:hypothetical protein